MPLWRFRNLTQNVLYEPILESVHISDSIPCGLKTFTCLISDPDNELEFDERDENAVEYAIDDVNYVDLHAGDISAFHQTHLAKPSPRVWALTVQDYTARLDWTVIENGDRTVQESVTARVNWIMGHTPTHHLTTGGVATIATTIEPFDYTGMTKREALDQVAGVVMALYYCAGKDLQFFLQDDPPSNPAPFALAYPEDPPTSYTYHDFDLSTDPLSQVDEILARGDGVSVKRTRVGAPAESDRRQRALSLPSIRNLSNLRAAADRELALYGEAERSGRLVTYQPGLEAAMTATIENSEWALNESWVLTDVDIRPLTGNENPSAPGLAEFTIAFAKQFACRLERSDQDRGDTLDSDGASACVGCSRIVTLLPSGMDSDLALAHGALLGIYVYDGTTLVRYRCNLRLVWEITPGASNPLLFGHEAETYTPVLVSPRAYRIHDPEDPAQRWDISQADIDFLAAQTMDAARFWQVVDKGAGEIIPLAWRGWSLDHVDFTSAVAVGGFLQPGDVAVVMTMNGIGTAPSLAAGFTNIDHRDQAGGSTRIGYRVLQAGDTGSGVWAGSGLTMVAIYRGVDATPIGNTAYLSGTSNPKVPAISAGTAGSWILAMTGGASESLYAQTPTGLVNRSSGFLGDVPNGSRNAMIADSGGPLASYPETAFGSSVYRSWAIEIKVGAVGGGGGGISGPALQRRAMQTGDLIAEIELNEATTQIRRTPNGQNVFVLEGTGTLTRYDKQLGLRETTTIAGFTTGLQDWSCDDDYNIYKLVGNVLTKYNRDGEELWSVDLFALKGYRFPSRAYSEGTGHAIIVDEHVRVAGYIGGADWETGSKAALLSVSRRLGGIRSVQRFGSAGDNAQAIAVHRAGNCLYLAGAASGSEFEDVSLGGLRGWIMRIPAALAD